MDCVFSEYVKFVDTFLINYFKLLLSTKYEKGLVKPFIDKYIDVRYYNKYVVKDDKFTNRLNKELNNIAKELLEENSGKEDKIKNVFALFSYVLYIDGCLHYSDLNVLLKTLFSDKNITLEYSDATKKELNSSIREYINKKVAFFKLFNAEEFYLKGRKYTENVYHVDLGQNCNVSKLYSEYAVEKAYNSDVVFENRTYLTILMCSSKILSEAISLNFNNTYVVDFPASLLEKPKKIIRFLIALDDDLLRTKICIKFSYRDYKEYKKDIKNLINQDYSVCLELDETYDIDFDDLFLFTYVIVHKKYKYYQNVIDNKDEVKTNIIVE